MPGGLARGRKMIKTTDLSRVPRLREDLGGGVRDELRAGGSTELVVDHL